MLTLGKRVCGDVLECGEGGVGLERLRNVLCALSTNAVKFEAVSESRKHTSRGADGREMACCGVLEGGEGLVLLQGL